MSKREVLDLLDLSDERQKRTSKEADELIKSAESKCLDKEYEKTIDDLIPVAELIANDAIGLGPGTSDDRRSYSSRWDKAFHTAMDKLCLESGVRRMTYQAV